MPTAETYDADDGWMDATLTVVSRGPRFAVGEMLYVPDFPGAITDRPRPASARVEVLAVTGDTLTFRDAVATLAAERPTLAARDIVAALSARPRNRAERRASRR